MYSSSYWVVPETEGDIYHYGVKGMKWGIRRKRKSSARPDRPNASADYRRSAELSRKPMHELSNKELQDLNYRYNLERQYAQYTKKPLTRGQKFARKAGKIALSTLSAAAVAGGVAYATTKIKDPDALKMLKGAMNFVPGASKAWDKAQENAEFMKWAGSKISENHRNYKAAKAAAHKAVVLYRGGSKAMATYRGRR